MCLIFCVIRCFVFCLFLCSCRREHERHIRAYRFSCPCNPTQLVGPQPLFRAKRPELKSGSWGHGCAGRDGSAAEGWERTISHYHGCAVSVCRQMMSNASQPRIGATRGKKEQWTGLSLSSLGTLMANLPHFPLAVLLCSLWDSGRAIVLWPGAQQQPSENGLRRLRELPVHFAIDYRGWTPISHPAFSLHFHSQLPSQSDWLLAGLQDCITTSALLTGTPLRTTIVNFWSAYQTADGAFHCFQQGIVPCVCQRLSHTP